MSACLFIITLDPLLRNIASRLPSVLTRAYADDVAGCMKLVFTELPVLLTIISCFSPLSEANYFPPYALKGLS